MSTLTLFDIIPHACVLNLWRSVAAAGSPRWPELRLLPPHRLSRDTGGHSRRSHTHQGLASHLVSDPVTGCGWQVREGLHYNPYFTGGAIAMPKMLMDGGAEYEDDTPATESQLAKDVVTFLSWAAEPEMDDRKLVSWPLASSL